MISVLNLASIAAKNMFFHAGGGLPGRVGVCERVGKSVPGIISASMCELRGIARKSI